MTVFLHHCPRDVLPARNLGSIRLVFFEITSHGPATHQIIKRMRIPQVLQRSTLDGSGNIHSVGTCDQLFVRPLRFAEPHPRTQAAFKFQLRQAKHCLVDLLSQLDHFSPVWSSVDDTVKRLAVELHSVPFQQPRAALDDPWDDRVRDGDARPCLTHYRPLRRACIPF